MINDWNQSEHGDCLVKSSWSVNEIIGEIYFKLENYVSVSTCNPIYGETCINDFVQKN